MDSETVVISKAEYAELLRCKAAVLDSGTLAEAMPPFVKDHQPGKHMSAPERGEVRRLHHLGYRPSEMVEFVGVPVSTISRFIRDMLKNDNGKVS